jgi:hypothetical protein
LCQEKSQPSEVWGVRHHQSNLRRERHVHACCEVPGKDKQQMNHTQNNRTGKSESQ